MRIKHIIIAVLVILLAGQIGYSQVPMRAKDNKSAVNVSDSERINLSNGKFSFNLPLASIGGRGVGNGVSFNFESGWRIDNVIVGYSGAYPNIEERIVRDPYAMSGVYAQSGGYIFGTTEIIETVEIGQCSNETILHASKVALKLNFNGVGGQSFTFYSQANDGQYITQFPIYENGGNNECANRSASLGTVFIANDGSGAKFISNSPIKVYNNDITPQVVAPSGVIKTTGGMTYGIVSGLVNWVEDRNGNRTNITNTGYSIYPSESRVISVKDALNREIQVSSQGSTTNIVYKGVGGVDRTIKIAPLAIQNGYFQTYGNIFPWLAANDPRRNTQVYCNGQYYIELPDSRKYTFTTNCYGEMSKIQLPTGGSVEYDYEFVNQNLFGSLERRIKERRSYSNGTILDNKTQYIYSDSTPQLPGQILPIETNTTVKIIDNQGVTKSVSRTYFYGCIQNSGANTCLIPTNSYEPPSAWEALRSRVFKQEIYAGDATNLLRKTETVYEYRTRANWNPLVAETPYRDFRVKSVTNFLADSGQMSKVEYGYDSTVDFNLQTDTLEYDYGSWQPGNFVRRSHTEFKKDITYTNNAVNLRTLPIESWVSSDIGGGNIVSRSKYEYDNYSGTTNTAPLLDRANITGHDAAYGTIYTTRGNPTKITTYADAQNQTGAISVHSQYDIAGNVVKVIDAKGYASTVSYNDNFGTQNAEARTNQSPTVLNGLQTFAFATSATNIAGYTTYAQFDYFSGAGMDAEDINGNISTTYYNDILDRPTQTISANNRPNFRRQMTANYQDNLRKVTVTSDSKTFGDNLLKSESFYDGLGRTFESRSYENATDYVAGLTQYDSLGRAYKSSNPYRPYLNEQPIWTTSYFDDLGRVTKVKSPDNGEITRQYYGSSVRVFDQAGRSRAGVSDALGRLTKVVEYDNGADLETLYTYDVLGRLRKTTQGTQNRFFMYNDLGRLIRAKQTEQLANSNLPPMTDPITGNSNWSVAYSYDNNGNVASTTDSRNKTITGTYDNLNRLTLRDYSDTTPDVSFAFDNPSIPNSKGQLTAVTSSVSANYYTAFDELGRIKSNQQVTNGTTYNFPNYSYDLSGALIQQTYPSGRVVKTESDAIGRLSKVSSQIPTQVERTYLSNLSYTAFGGVTQAKLGNGRWESMQFDAKTLQTTQIGLGYSATNTNLLKIEYNYGTTTPTTSDNNGSLRQQKISYAGQTAQITQNYTYDMLNRLKSATETVSGNTNPTWKQTFNYDIYGNRRFDAANTTTLPANNGIYNPNIGADNKFLVSEGYNYDSEGNLTSNPESQLFQYDAENRQTQVTNTASNTTANYQYDGGGKRVRKTFGNEETIFVYDAFGKMIAEYSNIVETRPKSVSYLTTDALGSPRIVTDATGNVISRHDYMPFGEEVMAGTGGRMTTQGYAGNDGVKQQFTGYERDGESGGLDYAQARYYNSKHGRFTSVDPLTASASMKNPQTFNRYSYAMNSPYQFVDPLGLKPCVTDATAGGCNNTDNKQDEPAELSQSQRNQALTQLIFDRASQGYATDMGAVTGSMIGYTATDINNNVSGNFSVSSGTLTMTNVQTTTVTRFRSDGTQIGQPKVTTRTDTLTLSGTSGTGDCMNNPDCAKDSAEYKGKGPTPIGSYTINTKSIEMIDTPKTAAKVGKVIGTAIRSVTGVRVSPDWGSFRIPLNPNYSTQFRDGAYLHGGSFPGTIGCVDIGGGEFGDSRTRSVLKLLRTDSDYSVAFTVSN